MANEQNLQPIKSKKKARELGSKGGKASGEAKRKRKAIKEQLEMFLSLPLKDEKAKAMMKSLGVDVDDIDNQMAIVLSMWKQALGGNVKAFNSIRDMIDGKPKETIEISNNVDDTVKELEKMLLDE